MKYIKTNLFAVIFCWCSTSLLQAQNYSLNFDGTDDYITLGDSFNFDVYEEFMVEAWVKTSASTGRHQVIARLDNKNRGWGLEVFNGKLQGYVISQFGSNEVMYRGETNVADGKWHHVAMTYGMGFLDLFVDSKGQSLLIVGGDEITASITTNAKTNIGCYDSSGVLLRKWVGLMDDVKIWRTNEGDVDIFMRYKKELSGNEPLLVAYYKFDNKTSLCDVECCGGSKHHGIRKGAAGSNNLPQYSTDTPAIKDVGCGALDTKCSPVGATESGVLEALEIFPNPTTGLALITSNSKITSAQLRDISGRNVDVGLRDNELDISAVPSGLYYVQIVSGNKQVIKKLIKI